MKKTFTLIFAAASALTVFAQDYVIISTPTKVFEQPVAKDDFAALNSKDIPVTLQPGMAYKITEAKGGWYVIEYSSGLRGMVMQNVIADTSTIKTPAAGTYKVANNPSESVTVTNAGGNWILKSGSKEYQGKTDGKIVTFLQATGPAHYTLVNLNGKNLVFNYDNSVTGYF